MYHNTALKLPHSEKWIPSGHRYPLQLSPLLHASSVTPVPVSINAFEYSFYGMKNAGPGSSGQHLVRTFHEDVTSPFVNSCHFLQKQVMLSRTVAELDERIMAIARWRLTNVGPRHCGFYSGVNGTQGGRDFVGVYDVTTDAQGREFYNTVHVHAIAVFKHSDDLLAFKLKFML